MCTSPNSIRVDDGFDFRTGQKTYRMQEVKCNRCWQCSNMFINQTIYGFVAEHRTADALRFVTLTIREGPERASDLANKVVRKDLVQAYIRAVRDQGRKRGYRVSVVAVSERGKNGTRRPHYHLAIAIYGEGYSDLDPGRMVHRPQWPHGHMDIQFVEPSDVSTVLNYMMPYVVKELAGMRANGHGSLDGFFFIYPRRPVLGASWIEGHAIRHAQRGDWTRDFNFGMDDGADTRVVMRKPTRMRSGGREFRNRRYPLVGVRRRIYLENRCGYEGISMVAAAALPGQSDVVRKALLTEARRRRRLGLPEVPEVDPDDRAMCMAHRLPQYLANVAAEAARVEAAAQLRKLVELEVANGDLPEAVLSDEELRIAYEQRRVASVAYREAQSNRAVRRARRNTVNRYLRRQYGDAAFDQRGRYRGPAYDEAEVLRLAAGDVSSDLRLCLPAEAALIPPSVRWARHRSAKDRRKMEALASPSSNEPERVFAQSGVP